MNKLIRSYANIKDFQVTNEQIIALRGEMLDRSVSIISNVFQENVILKNVIIPSFKVFEDYLWVYSKGKTYEYRLKKSFEDLKLHEHYYPTYANNTVVIGNVNSGEKAFLQARSIPSGEVLWSIDFTSTLICFNNEFLFVVSFSSSLKRKSIHAIELGIGSCNWIYKLPFDDSLKSSAAFPLQDDAQEEILKIVGVYTGVLWLVLTSCKIIGLDVATGKELYRIISPSIYPSYWTENQFDERSAFGPKTEIDGNNGKLFGIFNHYLGEIDLNSPDKVYSIYDLRDTCLSNDIDDIEDQTHNGTDIIFSQRSFASEPSVVGIFSRQKREIVWTSRELGEKGILDGVKKVAYKRNTLFVLDFNDMLHIFR